MIKRLERYLRSCLEQRLGLFFPTRFIFCKRGVFTMEITDETVQLLIDAASKVQHNAYAPYSQFKVGSALLDEEGRIHVGCNVENAAYGPSNCAERTAIFRAIADGCAPKTFQAIAVIADTDEPVTPCGVCRQVLSECCHPDMPVVMGKLNGDLNILTVSELLPGAFRLHSEE